MRCTSLVLALLSLAALVVASPVEERAELAERHVELEREVEAREPLGNTDWKRQLENTDWKRQLENTDWKRQLDNTDWKKRQLGNTDWKKRLGNTDW